MNKRTKSLFILLGFMLFVGGYSYPALASENASEIPPGFYLISSVNGIELYRKDYKGGNPDFVQVVDLSKGSQVRLLHGEIIDFQDGQGAFGGRDAKFQVVALEQFWDNVSASNPGAFCVSNGEFFKLGETPTRLPFSLKVDGEILSDGYGKDEYPGQKMILEIWADRVDIKELSLESLNNSSAPNIVAGLTEDARKSPQKYVARTFVGIDNRNGDGKFETVLIFNTRSARQKDAAGVLREFGAEKIMMLDGGGSTQLICQGSTYIASDRPIPQAIAVIAAGDGSLSVDTQVGAFSFPENPEGNNLSITQGGMLNLSDMKWVLFAVLPVGLILVLAISRMQRRAYY